MTSDETRTKAEEAVDIIILDMSDRSGFDDFWDGIDGDTQVEIRRAWREIIAQVFEGAR